jgi:hypothetical protein
MLSVFSKTNQKKGGSEGEREKRRGEVKSVAVVKVLGVSFGMAVTNDSVASTPFCSRSGMVRVLPLYLIIKESQYIFHTSSIHLPYDYRLHGHSPISLPLSLSPGLQHSN